MGRMIPGCGVAATRPRWMLAQPWGTGPIPPRPQPDPPATSPLPFGPAESRWEGAGVEALRRPRGTGGNP